MQTFNPKDKVDQAIIDKRKLEFCYRDGSDFYFMDPETYDQHPYDIKLLGKQVDILKENVTCLITEFDGECINITLPEHVNLEVAVAEPAVKGDTATNVTKLVTMETGAEIRVPQFIKAGDVLRIDSETHKYIERVNK